MIFSLLVSLRNSPEFQKLLGIAMELFLLCSDDAESDVRMVADECLNKVIKVRSPGPASAMTHRAVQPTPTEFINPGHPLNLSHKFKKGGLGTVFSELGVAGGLWSGAVPQLSHWLHHSVGGASCRLQDCLPSLQGVGGAGADGDSWVRLWGRVQRDHEAPGLLCGVSSSLLRPSLCPPGVWAGQCCLQVRL